MIRGTEISFAYGKKQVLKDVHFCFEDGRITALLGRNGSGKSTLLKVLCTGAAPSSGEIEINGVSMKKLSRMEKAERIAFLPQQLPSVEIPLEQLAGYGLSSSSGLFGTLSKEKKKKVNAALKKAGMEEKRHQLVSRMSGGERQIAYLLMLELKDSGHLLLDEPASNLDVLYKARLHEVMLEMKKQGKCVVFSTHDLNEVLDVADDVLILDEGMVCFHGTKEEMIASGKAEELFHVFYQKLKDENGRDYEVFLEKRG